MNHPDRPLPSPSADGSPPPARWLFFLPLLAGLLAYAGALWSGVQTWSRSPDEQHGFLVIPIALLLLYLRRDEFPRSSVRIDLRGLILIAVAAAMRIYGDRYIRPWLDLWSLPLWVGGAVWLFGGWKVFRWAAPAIVFLVFMAPLPGQVQTATGFPLQRIAAVGGGGLLQILGQPAFVSGTTILLGEHVLDVERACSGLRMFQGMLAVAVGWSLFSRYPWPRFAVMLAIAPLIAIFVNVLRIAVTGLMFQFVSGEAAQAFSHDWAGILMIPTGIAIFFLIDSLGDRLSRWNGGQVDRWLVTAAAAAVVLLIFGGASYGIYQRQQQRAVVFVLDEARELADGEPEQRQRAADLYRRYLIVNDEDAEVLSELATLWLRSDPGQWPPAARLFERAYRYDASRESDAIASLMLLASTGDWQRLWEQSDRIIGRLRGDLRRVAIRLRTQAVGNLIERTGVSGELDRMFAACREGVRDDPDYFRHAWQLAVLARMHPNRVRRSDLEPDSESEPADDSGTWKPDTDLPVSPPDAMALAIIDRLIERNPQAAPPWLYRANLLEAATRGLRAGVDDTPLRDALAESVERATQISAKAYPIGQPLPPMPDRQVAEDSAQAVLQGESLDVDGFQPIVAGAWRSERAERSTAGTAFLFAGTLALRDGDVERARGTLAHAIELAPRNPDAYLRLAQAYPADAHDERIALYERGLDRCGRATISLLFPLVESYVAAGRDDDAAELLEPLDEILPDLQGVARGRLTLMRGAAQAGGLSRQGRLRDAAERLEATLADEAVRSARSSYAALYARAHFQLGTLYRAMSRNDAAIAAFEQSGRFDPAPADWMIEAARGYELAGDLAAAQEKYQQAATKIGAQQPGIYLAIARVMLAQQRQTPPAERNLEEVRSVLRVAATRGAASSEAASILAETFVIEGDFDRAIRVIERQVEASPDNPAPLFNGAMIRQLAGDTDAALEQVARYRDAGASDSEAALLKTVLLARDGQVEAAEQALEAVGQDVAPNRRRSLKTQVILAKLRGGDVEQAAAEFQTLVDDHPDDLGLQRLAADVFTDLGNPDAVEQAERNLKRIEGDDGSVWRMVRASRLLRSEPGPDELGEIGELVDQLTLNFPNWGRTRYLRGRLAERAGRWGQALAEYEEAWQRGIRDTDLASRLLVALNRTGQTRRAGEYMAQLQELVPQSTSLFDIAMPQYVRGDRSVDALEIARRWAEQDPTPENLVRLGQTLMTIVGSGRTEDVFSSDQAVAEVVDQAEQAFTAAIRDDPENVDAWVGAFRVQAGLRRDRDKAIESLQEFSRQLEIPPLRRSFLLAQLYAAIGETARAGVELERSLELAQDSQPELRQAIRIVAVRFFAPRRPERALELARETLRESPDSPLAKTYLVSLLADRAGPADLDEALELQSTLMGDEPSAAQKRLRAQLLANRAAAAGTASANPAGADGPDTAAPATPRPTPSQDRQEALRLLREITPPQAADALAIAEILADEGQTAEAFNAFRDGLRLETPTAGRLATALQFWNERYAASGEYAPIADRYFADLRDAPGGAVAWLRLSLRRAAIEARIAVGETDDPSADPSPFESALRQRETEIIERFRDTFVPAEPDARFVDAVVGLITGIAAVGRAERIPDAIEQLNRSPDDAPAIGSALALALIRWGAVESVTDILTGEIRRRVLPDDETMAEQVLMAGDAFYLTGRLELALRYLRGAVGLLPQQSQAANNLALVLAEAGQDADEALRMADRAIELDPDNPGKLDTKLVVAMLLGRWPIAEQMAEKLADEADPTVLMHRAYLARKQGRDEEAHELFKQARDGNVAGRISAPSDLTIYDELTSGDGGTRGRQ